MMVQVIATAASAVAAVCNIILAVKYIKGGVIKAKLKNQQKLFRKLFGKPLVILPKNSKVAYRFSV